MKSVDSEKELLLENLKHAVLNCPKLKIGRRELKSFFTITIHSVIDLTEDKYKDGTHSFNMDTTIKIDNKRGESVEEPCDIHFNARIEGTKAEIENGIVFADKDFIPFINSVHLDS